MTDAGAIRIRPATDDERDDVLNVLDGALLETDADAIDAAIATERVIVAVDGGHVVGALVLDGERIESVAVRRMRRGRGVGSALVREAARGCDRLVVDFDEQVRPFYEALGFDIDRVGDGRLRGTVDRGRLVD